MLNVSEIMERDITAIGHDDTLNEAIELLIMNHKIGLPVVNDKGVVIGFFSEKEIISAALPEYFSHLKDKFILPDIKKLRSRLDSIKEELVCNYMNKAFLAFKETDTVLDVLIALNQKHLRTVPIIDDNGVLLGIISSEDVLLKRIILDRIEV